MKDLRGKTVVVTGAASGIGYGLAERFAQEGMKVVLADIDGSALAEAERMLRARDATVLAVRTDVSREQDVRALAQQTLDAFGAVHVVCNNAGVWSPDTLWNMSRKDWEWILRVNLDGTINSIRTFIPIMIAQNEGHMINTASAVGLTTATLGAYSVTKHAIVAASEALYHGLASEGHAVHVSVLCPGWVQTRLIDASRNRQAEYRDPIPTEVTPKLAAVTEALREAMENGVAPKEVADAVVRAIAEERFYILTHPEVAPLIRMRFDDILNDRKPTSFL